MKKFGLILLVFLLVLCNSSNESTEVVDTTTTLINEDNSIDEGDPPLADEVHADALLLRSVVVRLVRVLHIVYLAVCVDRG